MAEQQWYKPGVPLRPQRLEFRTTVRYRPVGTTQWLVGRSENISLTGILIRPTRLLAVGAKVELIVKVPASLVPEIAGEMFFSGSVARVAPPRIVGEAPSIGIAFELWRPVAEGDV